MFAYVLYMHISLQDQPPRREAPERSNKHEPNNRQADLQDLRLRNMSSQHDSKRLIDSSATTAIAIYDSGRVSQILGPGNP